MYVIQNTLGVKNEAISEAPVTSIICISLKDVISGREQVDSSLSKNQALIS